MSEHFDEHIVARFGRLFGEPTTPDFEGYVAEYRKALAGTAAHILAEAVDLVVKRHKYRNWPTVAECVEAVNEVAEQHAARRQRERPPEQPRPWRTPTAEEKARVSALIAECAASLEAHSKPPLRSRLPAADRNAWEARFGKAPAP